MVAEAGLGPELVIEVLPLAFGRCRLQVQVPERSGIQDVRQLVGKKIVTSFSRLSSKFFAELDTAAGAEKPTMIERIGGSVEAACALGLADGIVDLVGPRHFPFAACAI